MALTVIESLALWGIPLLTILVTLAYYFRWGKEPTEGEDPPADPGSVASGGEH